jgi:hypothetical protein
MNERLFGFFLSRISTNHFSSSKDFYTTVDGALFSLAHVHTLLAIEGEDPLNPYFQDLVQQQLAVCVGGGDR